MIINTYSSNKRQLRKSVHSFGKFKRTISSCIITVIMFALAIVILSPIYYVVVSTFKNAQEVTFSPMSMPVQWEFGRYKDAWEQMEYLKSLANTLIIAIPTVLFSTLFSTSAAYAIVRCPNRVNRAVFWLFLSGMMIPGNVSLISLYRLMLDMKLNNTHLGLILLGCGGVGMMTLFMLRNYLNSPDIVEIEQAASLDGCGILQCFFRIVLPLVKPILATNMIINLMGVWNDYLTPSLFLSDPRKYTLMIAVYQNVGQFSTDWLTMFNMLVLALLPLTIIYVFLQKDIISGVTAGAVKG